MAARYPNVSWVAAKTALPFFLFLFFLKAFRFFSLSQGHRAVGGTFTPLPNPLKSFPLTPRYLS